MNTGNYTLNSLADTVDFAVSNPLMKKYLEKHPDFPFMEDFNIDTVLLRKAIDFGSHVGIVEVLRDEFGPDIITVTTNWHSISEFVGDKDFINLIGKYKANGKDWLFPALIGIHNKLTEIRSARELSIDIWTPIPLDRNDEKDKDFLEDIDRASDAIRGDNGYAGTFPQERSSVLKEIDAVRSDVTDGQTSVGRIQRLVAALKTAAGRLGNSASGAIVHSAIASTKKWLESKFAAVLDEIWKLMI